MNVLAFDTSTELLSIALRSGNKKVETTKDIGLQHAQLLLPAIDNLFSAISIKKSSLDLVVCAKGPGSFTGLRIGMATAKGISSGLGIPLVAVYTLDAYAYGLDYFDGIVVPLIDAKKGRFYTALYQNGERETDFLDISPEALRQRLVVKKRILATGPHAPLMSLKIDQHRSVTVDPFYRNGRAGVFLELGIKMFEKGLIESLDSGPLYLRRSEAERSRKGNK